MVSVPVDIKREAAGSLFAPEQKKQKRERKRKIKDTVDTAKKRHQQKTKKDEDQTSERKKRSGSRTGYIRGNSTGHPQRNRP